MTVWWGTEVECSSAIARRWRSGGLTADEATGARQRLAILVSRWTEVEPSSDLRVEASLILQIHDLRAADALQLAAASTVSGPDRASWPFVCLDRRLRAAAELEGFPTLPPV